MKLQTAPDVDLTRVTLANKVQSLLHSRPVISPALILIVTIVVFALLDPRFVQPNTLSLLLQQTSVIAILAIAQTLILLTAGLDLSVGAITVLASIIMGKLAAEHGVPPILAILVGIVAAVACGALNGLLVTVVRLPPFIVTLGTLGVFTALMILYSLGQTIPGSSMPHIMTSSGDAFSIGPLQITYGLVVVALILVIVSYATRSTPWGKHLIAVGDDVDSARLAGVRVKRTLLSAYVVAGLIYGLGAWVLMGRVGGASPNAIGDINLETITAAVIGGTSLFGGRGGVAGTVVGALIVQAFAVGLALLGVDSQYRLLAVGVLVIGAAALDVWIRSVR